MKKRDHNIITFLPFLSSFQTLSYIHSPLNLWPLFSLIVIAYMYIHIHMYILRCILLSLYTVTCMHVLGLTSWHWTTNWCAPPWGSPPFLLPASLFVSGCGFMSFSLTTLTWPLVSSLFSSYLGSHVGKTLKGFLLKRKGQSGLSKCLELCHYNQSMEGNPTMLKT